MQERELLLSAVCEYVGAQQSLPLPVPAHARRLDHQHALLLLSCLPIPHSQEKGFMHIKMFISITKPIFDSKKDFMHFKFLRQLIAILANESYG